MFKKVIIISLFFLSFLGISFASDSLPNTGFVKSGIWYSKDPFYAGDKIRIYTIIFNGSEFDLLGDLEFSDNDKKICTGPFVVASGKSQELWCDWTAASGTHKITAKIINSKIAPIGETPKSIILENDLSGVSERIIKSDPEKDIVKKLTKIIESETPKSSTTTLENPIEEKIKTGLDAVQKNVSEIAPSEIKKEDLSRGVDKVLSFVPAPIKNAIGNIAEKTGINNLKDPLSSLVDFLIAVYKFIINDPLLLIIIFTFLSLAIMKAVYNKITGTY